MTANDHQFNIGAGEVYVWHADLGKETDAQRFEPFLSPDELQRANRFRFAEHRRRFVVARGCLRQLLSGYLGIGPGEVAFKYSAEGKPSIDLRHGSNICFNVSHSEDIAALAFTIDRSIGIDVEKIRHDLDVDEIPKRFFSSDEQRGLAELHGSAKFQAFFNCWTRKEAYVKAVGSGLSLPLRDFDVSFVPGEPAKLLATRPDPTLARQWNMASLDFGDNCAAAVVVEGPIQSLEIGHFDPR